MQARALQSATPLEATQLQGLAALVHAFHAGTAPVDERLSRGTRHGSRRASRPPVRRPPLRLRRRPTRHRGCCSMARRRATAGRWPSGWPRATRRRDARRAREPRRLQAVTAEKSRTPPARRQHARRWRSPRRRHRAVRVPARRARATPGAAQLFGARARRQQLRATIAPRARCWTHAWPSSAHSVCWRASIATWTTKTRRQAWHAQVLAEARAQVPAEPAPRPVRLHAVPAARATIAPVPGPRSCWCSSASSGASPRRDVRHVELALEGSGLGFEPGDSSASCP